ncbi:MAG TPA: uroporphyrinogen-III synthase [Kofleriaceae bacterium]|nr:uroporphyrinogen-III synthase [Kofleriaceae bacterium]
MAYAVVTRDREGAAPYAAALAPLGLEVVAMPVTRTEPPEDPDALARALARGGHAAIVCASARAAAALVAAAEQQAAGPAGAPPLPEVWAVGPATARALEAGRIRAIVPDGVRDGAQLAQAMIAARSLAGARVLIPRAADGREEVIAGLCAAGAEIDDVIAYRTVAAPASDPALAAGRARLLAGDAAICVVLAPSQVAALAALVPLAPLSFAAIGETTAAALRAAGAGAVAVAATPTPAGIATAVRSVYPRKP